MRKRIVRLQVSCINCGRLIDIQYHSFVSMIKLKAATNDWGFIENCGNVCPECIAAGKCEKFL